MIKYGLIHNCDVTLKNVEHAMEIFGTSIYVLKGKTTRKRADPVLEDYVDVPKEIMKQTKEVTLAIDLMHFQT